MKKSIFILLIISGFFIFSCNKEKVSNLDELKSTDALMFKNSMDKTEGDIAWRLWRKSRNCFGGIGICHIEKNSLKSNQTSSRDNVVIPVSYNDDFVVFNFSQDVSNFNVDELKFYIDEKLTLNMGEKMLIINEGVYDYDSNIGEFGGYKIPISFE